MLGHNAGSMVASLSLSPELLIYLAIAKNPEGLQTTILNAKAKADYAQQVATSALNVACAAASAPRTHAQMAGEGMVPLHKDTLRRKRVAESQIQRAWDGCWN